MKASFVGEVSEVELLDPEASVWRMPGTDIELVGALLGLQPTQAIRAAWSGKRIGSVGEVKVKALHSSTVLAFRLEWASSPKTDTIDDTNDFPDGAAVLLPVASDASLMTMGTKDAPVNAWYWRADAPGEARNVISEGLGTTRTLDTKLVRANGIWKGGRWAVVSARPLRVQGEVDVVQLAAGQASRFGVAVWHGASMERAGIKAISPDWQSLELEASS